MSNIPSSTSADYASLAARLRANAEARAAQGPASSSPQSAGSAAPAPSAPAKAAQMVTFSSKGLELAQQGAALGVKGAEAPARAQGAGASIASVSGASASTRAPNGGDELAEARFSPKALELARADRQESGSVMAASGGAAKAVSGLAASFETLRSALRPNDAASAPIGAPSSAAPSARSQGPVAGLGGLTGSQSSSSAEAPEARRSEEQARPRGLAGAYHDGSGGATAAPAKKGGLFDSLG